MSQQTKLIASLEAIVGGGNVLVEPAGLKSYQIEGKTPLAVVWPADRGELTALVALAVAERLVTVPWGGGTKMATGNIPPRVDLVICTSRLNRIVDYDIANLSVSVESGLALSELQGLLAKEGQGFFFPLDPPGTSGPTLGGVLAVNDSGPRRFLYGSARDHILGLKFVSPTAKLVAAGGKTVKNVAGYDMTKLLIGSWGTLGIISEATFKILPLPEKRSTALAHFASPQRAWEMARKIVHSSLYPATVELLNPLAVKTLGLDLPGGYLLALALEGFTEAVARQERVMKKMAGEADALTVVILDDATQDTFWASYRDLALNLKKIDPGVISFKANFPISQLGEIILRYEKMTDQRGIKFAWTGPAGNGIIYGHLLIEEDLAPQEEALVNLISRLTAEAVNRGGNLLIQRCPGALKEKLDVWGTPSKSRVIMNRIKEEFDPGYLMNRGRFLGQDKVR